MSRYKIFMLCLIVVALGTGLNLIADQYGSTSGSSTGGKATVKAKLINESSESKMKMVTIQVTVTGVDIGGIGSGGSAGYGTTPRTSESTGYGSAGTGTTGTTGTTSEPSSRETGSSAATGEESRSKTGTTGSMATTGSVGTTGSMHESESAHLHYQLDNGVIAAAPLTTLTFANLTPGKHTVTVYVADSSHNPISNKDTVSFTIPGNM